jgi:hypothetical protein
MTQMRDLLDLVNEMSEEEGSVELMDSFDIELNEDLLIETGVVDFAEDGIVVEGDDKMLELLAEHGIMLEETDWSKYDEPTVSRIKKGVTKPVDKTDYDKPAFLRKKEKEEKKLDEKMVMGLPGDQGSKAMGEDKPSTNEDPLVTVHDKDGLHTHAHLSTVNGIFNVDVDASDVLKGPVNIKSGWEDGRDIKIELSQHHKVDEAEYQGRKVPLGKPMKGDVKKSKVYVRKPNGKVVKVNFGDKNMRIKKNIPGRRKNFRARHNCDNPGPRWKARYWSCRAW